MMRLHNGSVYTDAAQVDNDLLAPEHDRSGEAPQVTEEAFPEVPYHYDAPEAISPNDVRPAYSGAEKASANDPTPKKPFWKRKRWLLLLVAVIAAIAVGVGVGVGVGARHKSASPTESLPSEIQAENSKYSVLSDTGLASVVGSNGDRRIFFQDNNGTIRQAVFHGGKWAAPTSYTVTNDAKVKTPLAAILLPYEQIGQEVIVLYYMAENNSVITQAFAGGGWYNPGNQYGNSSFEAKPGSRYLSASFIPEEADTGGYGMLVLFEGTNGTVSAQAAHTVVLEEDTTVSLVWQDVTENLTSSFPSATFSGPFTITTIELGGDARLATLCRDASARDQSFTQLFSQFNNSDNSFARYESRLEEVDPKYGEADNADLVGISLDVDVALANVYNTTGLDISSTGPYGMVVNNSRLALFRTEFNGPSTGPSTEFPFARLTTSTPVNSTTFYLYHQMNGTHIAEESYDISIGAWTTIYVEIESP